MVFLLGVSWLIQIHCIFIFNIVSTQFEILAFYCVGHFLHATASSLTNPVSTLNKLLKSNYVCMLYLMTAMLEEIAMMAQ